MEGGRVEGMRDGGIIMERARKSRTGHGWSGGKKGGMKRAEEGGNGKGGRNRARERSK